MMIDLEKFGKDFIKQSRDITLDKYELIASGKMKSCEAQEIYALLKDFDDNTIEKIREVVVNVVDRTLFDTLLLFEQSEDWAVVNKKDANAKSLENLADTSDGLSGELYGEDGWIAKYSKYKK